MYTKAMQTKRVKKKPSYDEREEYRHCVERAVVAGEMRCDWCGGVIADGQEARHHVIPRSRGGKTHRSNLALVHAEFTRENCHRNIHMAGTPGWERFYRRYSEDE